MEGGFEKATSQNPPVVDSTMVFECYRTNKYFTGAEVKNVKASRSSRKAYGDRAVGYVKLKRNLHICIVR
ncbi:hypothetical protein JTB14_007700 [Gonioctena quinquepunctata]|nr:hypothetical protein JTB14_007700 [Gonioctena quinquepunctata]